MVIRRLSNACAKIGYSVAEHTRKSLHWKKVLTIFPSPAGMSLTKLSLGGNIPAQGEFSQ
jgi:hypothetical protein